MGGEGEGRASEGGEGRWGDGWREVDEAGAIKLPLRVFFSVTPALVFEAVAEGCLLFLGEPKVGGKVGFGVWVMA